MKTFENCTIRKKSINSGIGDCGKEKGGGCRGYVNGMDHGNPISECQKCRFHYLKPQQQPQLPHPSLPYSIVREWEEMRKAAQLLQDRAGIIVSGPNGKYVIPKKGR